MNAFQNYLNNLRSARPDEAFEDVDPADAQGNFLDPNPESYAPYVPEILGNPALASDPAYIAPLAGSQGWKQENPMGRSVSQRGYRNSGPAKIDPNNPAEQAIVNYIRQAATSRGIDPEIALRIARHEGGLDKYEGNEGVFPTGKSYWAFQLHYGGAGTPYAKWGNTAGMGNDFTNATGFQPGDPEAWQAAIDFALDHARKYGWKAWYGRGPAGVGEWDGIPR